MVVEISAASKQRRLIADDAMVISYDGPVKSDDGSVKTVDIQGLCCFGCGRSMTDEDRLSVLREFYCSNIARNLKRSRFRCPTRTTLYPIVSFRHVSFPLFPCLLTVFSLQPSSMVSFRHVSFPFFLCLLFLIFLSPSTAGQPFQNCGTTGNYTANSTYESNLSLVLPSLASNTSLSGGFLNATVGQIPNKIYGLAVCRGDTNASVCRSCLSDAIQDAPQLCPYNNGATTFYDDCLLRYSNQRFFSTVDTSQSWIMWDPNNVTDRSQFDKIVDELMSAITDRAVYNSTRMFATGKMMNSTKTPFPEIYGLVQCIQDLSRSQCQQCLQSILEPRPTQLEGRQEGAVLAASCNFRYGTSKFFDGPSTLRLEPPGAGPGSASNYQPT